jgi:hypothetical protein
VRTRHTPERSAVDESLAEMAQRLEATRNQVDRAHRSAVRTSAR